MLIFYDKEEMSAAEAAEYIGFVKGEYLAVDWERPVHTGAEIPWAVLMSSRSFHGGPKKYQVEFMEKSRDIRHWIIVILDVPPVFGPIVAKWKQINTPVNEKRPFCERTAGRSFKERSEEMPGNLQEQKGRGRAVDQASRKPDKELDL